MMRALVTTALLFLCAVTAGHAADNMKAFPPAEEGMVRYVLKLPGQADESAFKVALIVGVPIVVYVPEGAEVRDRIWKAGAEVKAIEKD